MLLQQSKLNTKKVIECGSPCHFETVIFKEFFSFINQPHVRNSKVRKQKFHHRVSNLKRKLNVFQL